MFKKILQIKNYGKYLSFSAGSGNWNGSIKKINSIYAENASGKTTFTQIFKSIKGDNNVIKKRKSFTATGDISIKLQDENNSQFVFNKSSWNRHFSKIEIFDTFFAEDNVYIISLGNYDKNGTILEYEFIFGEEGIKAYNDIIDLRSERKGERVKRSSYNRKLKQTEDEADIEKYQKLVLKSKERSKEINSLIPKLEKKLIDIAEDLGSKYVEKINYYLRLFNPNIQIIKLNKKGAHFIYHLSISDQLVRSDSKNISLRNTLSEGDKSSLSLSFFLARLDLLDDLSERVIIFDDPISSFDSGRRNVTINLLKKIAEKSKQFILLSHDLNFIKNFSEKFDVINNLKIQSNGLSSVIVEQDIEKETMTGIFKDITVLHDYLINGAGTFSEKREVIRCIRPTIEGIFRIKYFNLINRTDWLGDFLSMIRNSNQGDSFYQLKPIYEELSDINDYSKEFHHSNPNYLEVPINDEELRNYVKRTIDLMKKI